MRTKIHTSDQGGRSIARGDLEVESGERGRNRTYNLVIKSRARALA